MVVALGLRESEALGLTWDDVDLDERTLRVRHQLQRRDGEFVLAPLKSLGSQRTVALPAFAGEALRRHHAAQSRERLALGVNWENVLDLVFITPTGRPLHRRNVLRWFQQLLEREGLPIRGIKELRHTAASLLHSQGLSPREIADLLGHSDVRITLEVYTHMFEEGKRRAADRMDELFPARAALAGA